MQIDCKKDGDSQISDDSESPVSPPELIPKDQNFSFENKPNFA